MSKDKEQVFSNYIPISRKLFDHEFWSEDRVFSKAEAWIDLLRSASWEEERSRIINGKWVKWRRGQQPISLRYLGTRWKWSKDKASGFLEVLRRENMVEIETDNKTAITVITICKYDEYNPVSKKSRQGKRHEADSEQTADRQRPDKINNYNNTNKEKEECTPPTPDEVLFNSFSGWIDLNAPKVNQMKEPIDLKQFLKLRKDFPGGEGKKTIQDVLLAMHNNKDLLKKYESANLTLRSWINVRNKRNGETNYEPSRSKKLSNAVAQIREQEEAAK